MLGVIAALNLFLVAIVAINGAANLRDYGSFIASGKAASDGDNPYGVYEDTFHPVVGDYDVPSPNLNPPASVYPFQLLARFEPHSTKALLNVVWALLYAGLFLALLRVYKRELTPALALFALSSAGFWYVIELGQLYVPLLALTAAALLVQERHPVLAGLLIGVVVAFKPNFLIWPALLLLAGERRSSLTALTAAAGISLIPLALDGATIYEQWIEASRQFAGLGFPNNATLFSVFDRLGLPEAGAIASVALGLSLAAWALLARPSWQETSRLAIVGALLLGPVTWAGYTLLALPVLLSRPWGRWERLATALLCFPLWLVIKLAVLHPALDFAAGSVYAFAMLILFGLLAADAYRNLRLSAQLEGAPVTEEPAAVAA